MRILWLKTELLHPVDKGGKIRTFEMLKRLNRDHVLTYLTLDDGTAASDAADLAKEYCTELIRVPHNISKRLSLAFVTELALNSFSTLPFAISRYKSSAMERAIKGQLAKLKYDIVVADFLVSAVNVPEGIKVPTALFQHNVEALIWRRHATTNANPATKAFFYIQYLKMRAFERRECARFDHVITVSPIDSALLRNEYGIKHVAEVPTGVDTEFFRAASESAVQPANVVFTGSMDWLPNQDGIRFFVERVMPLVVKQVPEMILTVVGRDPPKWLEHLVKANSRIKLTGWVVDVRPYLERAACVVVPIRVGGGTRLKIYEAMSAGKAVVSTSVGAEGLNVRPGLNILIADTPLSFAEAVVRLLKERETASRLGNEAASWVRASHGWHAVADRFAAICADVVAGRSKRE